MTIVKVCGLQSLKDAQYAVTNGATHIGVICVPNRKRTIPTDEAIKISEWVHTQDDNKTVKLVGVFQNQPVDEVKELADQYNLDIIQLHGDEDWKQYYDIIRKPIIKRCVFPQDCNKVLDINKLEDSLICSPLFDSAMGGTGELLNWDQIDKWAREQEDIETKFILAGGLTPLNVNEAFDIHGVIGVDVSGGVETDGIKDPDKIKKFIHNASSL
ncbi:hypothetical protein MOUN0_M08064 [Monosporozyma unispora]|nr:bifunctional tryptophan synthase trp1 [Kazachstania unispora]